MTLKQTIAHQTTENHLGSYMITPSFDNKKIKQTQGSKQKLPLTVNDVSHL